MPGPSPTLAAPSEVMFLDDNDDDTRPELEAWAASAVATVDEAAAAPENLAEAETEPEQSPWAEELKRIESCFELVRSAKVGKKNRALYRCILCFKYQDTAKLHSYRGKLHAYCTAEGGIKRNSDFADHVGKGYHLECDRTHRLSQMTSAELTEINPFTP